MHYARLIIAFVAAAVLGALAACGTVPPACSPASCGGCCDTAGTCQTVSTQTVCGSAGNACVLCGAGTSCESGVCRSTATGGGTGGGSTGGGTGGGSTGGGTGGGSTGGGGGTTCTISATGGNCPTPGQSCMYTDATGTTACFAGPCDVVTQNCPTPTDKCSYAGLADGGTGRACGPAGAKTEGQACGPSGDDCGKGLLCVNAKCEKFCYQASNCTAGAQCIGVITITGAAELPTTCVTLTGCDPLLQNCPSTQGCFLTQTGPACVTAGAVAPNGVCSSTMGCTRGNLCLVTMPNATSGLCKPYCNLDAGMPNCGGGACSGLQGVPYGVCP